MIMKVNKLYSKQKSPSHQRHKIRKTEKVFSGILSSEATRMARPVEETGREGTDRNSGKERCCSFCEFGGSGTEEEL